MQYFVIDNFALLKTYQSYFKMTNFQILLILTNPYKTLAELI